MCAFGLRVFQGSSQFINSGGGLLDKGDGFLQDGNLVRLAGVGIAYPLSQLDDLL